MSMTKMMKMKISSELPYRLFFSLLSSCLLLWMDGCMYPVLDRSPILMYVSLFFPSYNRLNRVFACSFLEILCHMFNCDYRFLLSSCSCSCFVSLFQWFEQFGVAREINSPSGMDLPSWVGEIGVNRRLVGIQKPEGQSVSQAINPQFHPSIHIIQFNSIRFNSDIKIY